MHKWHVLRNVWVDKPSVVGRLFAQPAAGINSLHIMIRWHCYSLQTWGVHSMHICWQLLVVDTCYFCVQVKHIALCLQARAPVSSAGSQTGSKRVFMLSGHAVHVSPSHQWPQRAWHSHKAVRVQTEHSMFPKHSVEVRSLQPDRRLCLPTSGCLRHCCCLWKYCQSSGLVLSVKCFNICVWRLGRIIAIAQRLIQTCESSCMLPVYKVLSRLCSSSQTVNWCCRVLIECAGNLSCVARFVAFVLSCDILSCCLIGWQYQGQHTCWSACWNASTLWSDQWRCPGRHQTWFNSLRVL